MSLRYPDQKSFDCFFVTTTFKEWKRWGETKGVYLVLADSIRFCLSKYNARLSGFVFMPSHVHLLIFINGNKLSDFMRDFKKYVSQKGFKSLGINQKQIWMPRFDRLAIHSEDVFRTKFTYIHNNPVKAGFVDLPERWRWSSALDYFADKNGLLPIWKGWA